MRTSLLILICVTFAHAGFWIDFRFPSDRSTVLWATCDGQPTKNETLACGVTHDYCLDQTKGYNDWQLFSWDLFVPQFATWLAPWVALISQLPYETKDGITNLMSLLLVPGSPCLATYSPALMVLNARWINRSFRLLRQRSKDVSLRPQRPEQYDALDSIRKICMESPHIPLGVTLGDHHDFSQMVVRPQNAKTWKDLRNEIFKTKREKTLSLWMSLAWVVILQALSSVQYFTTATTDNSVILGLAVNSLWTWMVPLVWGYVLVGTQNFARSIGEAFHTLRPHDMTVPGPKDPPASGSSTQTVVDSTADEDKIFALPQGYRKGEYHKNWLKILVDRTYTCQWSRFHTFTGFSIAGWSRQSGPLFVFARVQSHRIVCQHILDAFHQLLQRQHKKQTVHGGPWNEDNFEENLDGTAEQTVLYVLSRMEHRALALDCIVETNSLRMPMDDLSEVDGPKVDFRIHSGAPEGIQKDFVVASVAGLFLQWATTGSAIIIAYNTPIVGLGCVSGSFLIYGVTATIVWTLQVLSASLSHRWSELGETHPERMRAAGWLSLGAIAVYVRLAANTLAILNAIWVITFSTLQLTNLYNNCACNSSFTKGWVVISLIAIPGSMYEEARVYWIAGTATAIVSASLFAVFLYIARGEDLYRMDAQ